MKLTMQKSELERIIKTVQMAVPSKPSMRILECIRARVTPDTISVKATDLDIIAECEGSCESEFSGEMCIPSSILSGAVGGMQNGTVTIEYQDLGYSRNALVSMGRNSYTIRCMDPADFPKESEEDRSRNTVKMPCEDLKRVLRQTIHAVCRDKTRPTLCGVHLKTHSDHLDCVGTDGRSLAMARVDGEFPKVSLTLPFKVSSDLASIIPSDGDVEISFDKSFARFSFGRCSLRTKLIESEYPNYQRVIPTSSEIEIMANRADLLAAIGHVSVLTSSDDSRVKMTIADNSIRLRTDGGEYGVAQDEVEVKYGGRPTILHASATLLANQLRAMSGEDVRIGCRANTAIVFNDDESGYLGLVMPMRA